ncbi:MULTISPECIES: hypothetical protein [Pseudoalteromonas]|uniref:Chemotaxis protein n=1 Tax=Pseudoalteromonas amylolytica TaxID=1859457 RepID=A0A1S1MWC0_9GAMM|nr:MULTISPECIES: hypothetical protein [Pseudoalteromonas]OHU84954.1 hypothetical protein BFC16_19895 [Pseudoalteromonas sp. JW3]OHU90095.1 hypothetical protein BET10_15080 [Pseudoalteromonas amylolytica]
MPQNTTNSAGHGYQLSYGVAQSKNSDIQSLTDQVTQAQFTVNELSNVVASLTEKQAYFANLLALASSKQATSLSHYNQAKTLSSDVTETLRYVDIVATQIGGHTAASGSLSQKLSETAEYMSKLINKLIFSVDVIEKLSDFVNRRKAVNQVIPDDLITFLNNAVAESNNAVSLTLTALQSCYASITPVAETSEVSTVQSTQAHNLSEQVTHLQNLLQDLYEASTDSYKQALSASNMANTQLEDAQAQLAEAKATLASLNAGLEAAKAAAFAA